MNKQHGYTLIEKMMVLAILGVLVAIALPAYDNEVDPLVIVRKDMMIIEQRMAVHFASYGEYPESLEQIRSAKEDPWGNPYQYLNSSTRQGNGQVRKKHGDVPINLDFDLYSMGPDGDSVSPLTGVASRDDIVRANQGKFVDYAEEYCASKGC